jgi:menaquinone-dependent protoporphyrinogen IX oxidase
MTVLVAYARKHGSTQGIAERIDEQFQQLRKEAEAWSVDAVALLSEDVGTIIITRADGIDIFTIRWSLHHLL